MAPGAAWAQVAISGDPTNYTTIQAAVDDAPSGSTITVAAGVYVEQVTIDGKDLTLVGAGAGDTIVRMPGGPGTNVAMGPGSESMVYYNSNMAAVVGVIDADVRIEGMTIDADGAGTGATDISAITYYNSSGSIEAVEALGARMPYNDIPTQTLSGAQIGQGIALLQSDGAARSIEVSGSTIGDFQKTGILVGGAGLAVQIEDNAIAGGGDQSIIAQNGIQFYWGATGAVAGNIVAEIAYTGPASTYGSLILAFDADGVIIEDNELVGTGTPGAKNRGLVIADGGLGLFETASVTGNTFADLAGAVLLSGALDGGVAFTGNLMSGYELYALSANFALDASLNYWGSATPGFNDGVLGTTEICPYYTTADLDETSCPPVANPDSGLFHYTIQAAIDAAAPGDTVTIAAGYYEEDLAAWKDMEITKSLALVGAGSGLTVIGLSEGKTNGVEIRGSNLDVAIEGITFTRRVGSTFGPSFPLRVAETASSFDSFALRDVVVEHGAASNVILGANGTFGTVIVEDSVFRNAGTWGFVASGPVGDPIGGTGGFFVSGSEFTGNGVQTPGNGIGLDLAGAGPYYNVQIEDSLFAGNANKGLNLRSSSPVLVSGSDFIGNGSHGLQVYDYGGTSSSDILVDGCLFEGNQDGIQFSAEPGSSVSGIEVVGSSFLDNTRNGIRFQNAGGSVAGVVIDDCDFTATSAVAAGGGSDALIFADTILDGLTVTGSSFSQANIKWSIWLMNLASGAIEVSGNEFTGTYGFAAWVGMTAPVSVTGNSFENTLLAMFNNDNNGPFDASGNWWGTTDPAGIEDLIGGLGGIFWSPFLVDSDLQDPDASGIAPIFNTDDGRPFARIQSAVDDAAPGDTITVSGPVVGSILVDKPLTIQGAAASRSKTPIVGDPGLPVFTVASDGVTIDNMAITGTIGVLSDGFTDLAVTDNDFVVDALGIAVANAATSDGDAETITITGNGIVLTQHIAGTDPTIGIALTGIGGDAAAVVSGNDVDGAFWGYLAYAIGTSPTTTISNTTIAGATQGIAVFNTLATSAPFNYTGSVLAVANATIGDFQDPPIPLEYQSGLYAFTGSASDDFATQGIQLSIDGITVTGVLEVQNPSGVNNSAALAFADFGTTGGDPAPETMQIVSVANATITDNDARGIDAASRVVVSVEDSELRGNAFRGIFARNGAAVSITTSVLEREAGDGLLLNAGYTGGNPSEAAPSSIVAENNSIVVTGGGNFSVGSGGTIALTCNWWGTTNEATIATYSGSFNAVPFLVSSDLDNPACVGGGPVLNTTQGIPYASLAAALDFADEDDVLFVSAGASIVLAEHIEITVEGVTITTDAVNPATIAYNGNDFFPIFEVFAPGVTISNLTLVRDNATSGGQAIAVRKSDVSVLDNTIITNDEPSPAPAITVDHGLPSEQYTGDVSNILIEGNQILGQWTWGFGIRTESNNGTLSGVSLVGNTFDGAVNGGFVFAAGGDPGNVTDVSFVGNDFNVANRTIYDDTGAVDLPAFVADNTLNLNIVFLTDGTNVLPGWTFSTIQSAINAAPAGATVEPQAGTYEELVRLDKSVSLVAAPSITRSPTILTAPGSASNDAVVLIEAPDVAVDGFHIIVNQPNAAAGIVLKADAPDGDNSAIVNNVITTTGTGGNPQSPANPPAVGGGLAPFGAQAVGVVVWTFDPSDPGQTDRANGTTIQGNAIGTAANPFPLAALFLERASGQVGGFAPGQGNTLWGEQFVAEVRFVQDGTLNFDGNQLFGWGDDQSRGAMLDIDTTNPGATFNIRGNEFFPQADVAGLTHYRAVQVKNDIFDSAVVNIQGNTINALKTGLTLGNARSVTVSANTIRAIADDALLIEVNNKIYSSGRPNQPAPSVNSPVIINNTLDGNGFSNVVGLEFRNHASLAADNAASGGGVIEFDVTVGTPGNENDFLSSLATYIRLDDRSGPSNSDPLYSMLNIAGQTTMAPFGTDIDATNSLVDGVATSALGAAGQAAVLLKTVDSRVNGDLGTVDYGFTPPAVVYVDDDYAGESLGDLVDFGATTDLVFGVEAFSTIQDGVDAVADAGVVNVADGLYAENVVVGKALELRGPNFGLSPNADPPVRVAEAVIVPAATNTDTGVVVLLAASDAVVDGFTVVGDNPALAPSGIGASGTIDAAHGIRAFGDGLQSVRAANNIVRDTSSRGILFGQATNYFASGPPATFSSGNEIHDNLVEDIDVVALGIQATNSMYTAITDNVVRNVRYGIYLNSFRTENQGGPESQVVSGNLVEADQWGIWLNLFAASPYTVSDNEIAAVPNPARQTWYGIMLSTVSAPQNAVDQPNLPLVAVPERWLLADNEIDGGGADMSTIAHGYWLWHVDSNADAGNNPNYGRIIGGSVSNVHTGILMKNVDLDPSTLFGVGRTGAHASVSGVSIAPGSLAIGMIDNPSWTTANIAPLVAKRDVVLELEGSTLAGSGSGIGVVASGEFASAAIVGNTATISGFGVGVQIDGGTATISDNSIFDNGRGIWILDGGEAEIDGNDFRPVGPADPNEIDIATTSTAGAMSVGDTTPNIFAGSNAINGFFDHQAPFDVFAGNNEFPEILGAGVLATDADAAQRAAIEAKIVDVKTNSAFGDIILGSVTLFVDLAATSGSENGASWADAFLAIGQAVAAAQAGDEVWIADGVYNEAIVLDGLSVSLYGGFEGLGGAEETLLAERDWTRNYTIVTPPVDSRGLTVLGTADVVVDSIAFVDALAASGDTGGAVLFNDFDGTALLARSVVQGNASADGQGGGGIAIVGGSADITLEQVVAVNNSAVGGSLLRGTGASDGGGLLVANASGTIEVRESYLVGNIAEGAGGGLAAANAADLRVRNLVAGGNAATFGSAASLAAGTNALVAHISASHNQSASGGSIVAAGSTTDTTIVNTLVAYEASGVGIEERSGAEIEVANAMFDDATAWTAAFRDNAGTNYGTGLAATTALGRVSDSIDGDPLLRVIEWESGLTGAWTAVSYDPATGLTTLTTTGTPFFTGIQFQRFLDANVLDGGAWALVVSNTASSLRVMGDMTGRVEAGDEFKVWSWVPVMVNDGTDAGIDPTSIWGSAIDVDVFLRERPVQLLAPTLAESYDIGAYEVQDDPLFVDLVSFTASAVRGRTITIQWETSTEIDNAGFNLYRATANGIEKLTQTLIAPLGDEFTGAVYTFVDTTYPDGWTEMPLYFLEDVEFSGLSTIHGPAVNIVTEAPKGPSLDPSTDSGGDRVRPLLPSGGDAVKEPGTIGTGQDALIRR